METQKQFNFTHILAGASSFGKAVLSILHATVTLALHRVWCRAWQLSWIRLAFPTSSGLKATTRLFAPSMLVFFLFYSAVSDTHCLGNAVQTVKANDAVKFITVRGTAFEASAASGGSAASENGDVINPREIVESFLSFASTGAQREEL